MNMEIIGPFILTFISGFSTFLGIIPIFLKTNKVGEIITFTLSLSYITLLSISLFDLIPSSIKYLINIYQVILGLIVFLIGYTIILLLKRKEGSSLYKIGIISLISLVLHNIPEGIIVFISSYKNIKIGLKTVIAIICHNIPEGLLIAVPLYYSKVSKKNVIKNVLIASLSEPFGALLSFLFMSRGSKLLIAYIQLFVSGMMISLCINEIQKELFKYNNKKYVIIGFGLSIILISILSILNF